MSATTAGTTGGFLSLAIRLARRELRGGVRGLRLALACLALGVATIATVGGLRTGIERTDTQKVLDGDLDEFIEASLKSGLEAGSKRSDA